MKSFSALWRRDVTLGFRQGGGAGGALAFILAVLVLVPLALGPDQIMLQRVAPGIMWLALLLSILLTAERIFQQDYEDGSLDVMMSSSLSLELVCLAKALAHWFSVGLPVALVAPVLGILINIDASMLPALMLSMGLGSLGLSLLASIGGALTAGLRRGGLLVALLILPLYVPVLIFGISAVAVSPNVGGASMVVLAGLVLISLVVQPWACAAALRAYLR